MSITVQYNAGNRHYSVENSKETSGQGLHIPLALINAGEILVHEDRQGSIDYFGERLKFNFEQQGAANGGTLQDNKASVYFQHGLFNRPKRHTYTDVRGHFDKGAEKYNKNSEKVGWVAHERLFDALQVEIQKSSLPKTHSVLDLGAGTGLLSQLYKKHHGDAHITGVDLSQQSLDIAFAGGHLDRVVAGDIADLSWSDSDEFHVVKSSGALCFFDKTKELIEEMARVVKRNGLVGFTYEPVGGGGSDTKQHLPEVLQTHAFNAGLDVLNIIPVKKGWGNYKTGEDVATELMILQSF